MLLVLGTKRALFCLELLLATFFIHVFCVASHPNRTGQERSVVRGNLGRCKFGQLESCCYGWRSVNGGCQPMCKKSCLNGICTGPDRCSCQKGYTGKQCEKDINECGLPSRPCSHRCVNMLGSFRCFCEPGYTLDIDGRSCIKKSDCSSLHCQLGCQVGNNGALSCLCPPGLLLGSDNRTCKDVDECDSSVPICSERQACRNTFGSYMCVCRSGYMLGTLGNSITCRDEDECVTGRHRCSPHAHCINTEGLYYCRCEDDYTGNGFTCRKRKSIKSHDAVYFRYKLSKQIRPRFKKKIS